MHHPQFSESEEQYQERLRRQREERRAADERRVQEDKRRKARIKEERDRERLEAEQRQRQKVSQKKAQAEAQRKDAEQKVRDQLERSQALRSAVFSAARCGNSDEVKEGVYDKGVDAAGGEVKRGCDDFVETLPKDPQETLLHIAASQGDVDLVDWLIRHSKCTFSTKRVIYQYVPRCRGR